jgi:hypothetical protein
MLFFELFPAFVMLVAFAAGVWLFILDRQASRDGSEQNRGTDGSRFDWTGYQDDDGLAYAPVRDDERGM